MSSTPTVRLPKDLLARLRQVAQSTGLPVSRVIRRALETSLSRHDAQTWKKYAGVIKDGLRSVSSRKGFSRS